ncbi:MAG: FxsA family protein [Gammaproteobacteria bacterium]|nr:FxsA family protein [Gammaproteobacteria bacterium]
MKPLAILTLIFIVVPVLEIYLLIQVGGIIGAPWTIFLVLFTAILGGAMLRSQGMSALARAQTALQQGSLPAREMVDGLFLLVGGAFLLTPGFFTDALGFACLMPPLRALMFHFIVKRVQFSDMNMGGGHSASRSQQNNTIEGEFRRDD